MPPPLPPLPPDEPEETFDVEHYRGGEMFRQTFGPEQINEAQSGSSDQPARPRFRSSSGPRTDRSQSTMDSQRAMNPPSATAPQIAAAPQSATATHGTKAPGSATTSPEYAKSQSTATEAPHESPHQQTSYEQPVADQGGLHQPVAHAMPPGPYPQIAAGDVVAVENMSSYVTDLDQLPGSHEVSNSFVSHPDFVVGYNEHPTSSYVSDFNQLPGSYEVPNSYVSYSGLLPGFNEQPSSYVNRALESYVEVGPVSASATPSDENSQRVQPADESPAGQNVTAQKTEPPHNDQPQPVVIHRDLNPQQSIRTVPQQPANRRVAPDPEAGLTERVYMSVRSNQKKSLYSRFEN